MRSLKIERTDVCQIDRQQFMYLFLEKTKILFEILLTLLDFIQNTVQELGHSELRRQIPEIDASLGNMASIKDTILGRLVCHNTK